MVPPSEVKMMECHSNRSFMKTMANEETPIPGTKKYNRKFVIMKMNGCHLEKGPHEFSIILRHEELRELLVTVKNSNKQPNFSDSRIECFLVAYLFHLHSFMRYFME